MEEEEDESTNSIVSADEVMQDEADEIKPSPSATSGNDDFETKNVAQTEQSNTEVDDLELAEKVITVGPPRRNVSKFVSELETAGALCRSERVRKKKKPANLYIPAT